MNTDQLLGLRKAFLPGSRVQFGVPSDSEDRSEPYEKGTVNYVDDSGQLHITTDRGEEVVVDRGEFDLKHLSVDDQILEAEAIRTEQLKGNQRTRNRDGLDRNNRERDEQYV